MKGHAEYRAVHSKNNNYNDLSIHTDDQWILITCYCCMLQRGKKKKTREIWFDKMLQGGVRRIEHLIKGAAFL